MGDNVVSLDNHRPHISGEATCQHCGHKWAAVAIEGSFFLDCPKCSLAQGVWSGGMLPGDGEEMLLCGCGSPFFVLARKGAMCSKCGVRISDA